jgi:hypothetical protein
MYISRTVLKYILVAIAAVSMYIGVTAGHEKQNMSENMYKTLETISVIGCIVCAAVGMWFGIFG